MTQNYLPRSAPLDLQGGAKLTQAAPRRRLAALLLPALALLVLAAVAGLLWLPPADSAQAQAQGGAGAKVTAGPTITSSPASGDTYKKGEAIAVAVTFSEAVTVSGEPRVRLDIGEQTRWARYERSEADGTRLVFAYTVKENDRDDDGVSIKKNAVGLNGGTIADGDGNAAKLKAPALPDQAGHQVDGSPPPAITAGPVVVSSPQSGDTYGKGEAVVVTVTFSEAVTVSGQPRVRLAVGEQRRWARYARSEADGTRLVFAYKVKGDDRDDDGVSIPRNGLGLNGGSIADADGNAARLKAPALADQAGHKVDGSQEAAPADGQESPADRLGVVSLDLEQDPPTVGTELSATLLDPDGEMSGLTWTWQRSSDGTTWQAIAGATGTSYTATEDDVGNYLRATAAYTDGHGPGKTASAATSDKVLVPPPDPNTNQITNVWSATLTVDAGGGLYGCDNGPTVANCSTALNDDDFVYAGTTYTVNKVYWASSNNILVMQFSSLTGQQVKTALSTLRLVVRSDSLNVSDATVQGNNIYWSYDPDIDGDDWADGDTVSLSLRERDMTPPTYTLSKFLFEDPFTDAEMNVTPPSGTGNSGTRPLSPVLVFSEEIRESQTVIKYQVGSGPERTFTFSGEMQRFGPGECAFVLTMPDGRHYYCNFTPGPEDRGLFKVKVERFEDIEGNAGAAGSYNTAWGYTVDGRMLPAPTLALKNSGTTWPPTFTATVPKTGVRVALFKDKDLCEKWGNNRNTAWTVTDTTAPYTVDLTNAFSSDPTPASGSFHTFYARYIDGDNRESECSDGFRYTYYGNTPQLTNFRALAGHGNIGADWSLSWHEPVWNTNNERPSKWEYRILPGDGMGTDSEQWRTASSLNSYRGYGRVGGLQRIATLNDYSTLLTNGMPYTVQVRVYKNNGDLGWISPAVTVAPRAYSAPAPQTVPADWPLLPLWSEPGDKFRLMFVTTDKIHAMSHDAGHYNSLAQMAAARNARLVNSDGDHFGGEFRAIVSTAAVDARDNTASTGRGVPIYFLGGNKVADDYADFYDGSWNPRYGNATNEMGRGRHSGLIWTGSRTDGTKDPSNHVGRRSNIRYATVLIGGTLATGATDWERPNHLYALSPVITVASE